MPFFLAPAALILLLFFGAGPAMLIVLAALAFTVVVMVPIALWLGWIAFLIACIFHPVGWGFLMIVYFIPVVIPTLLFSGTAFGDTMVKVAHWYGDVFWQIFILPAHAWGWAKAVFQFIA